MLYVTPKTYVGVGPYALDLTPNICGISSFPNLEMTMKMVVSEMTMKMVV